MPLDILEFFCLTPLPGSEDHKTLFLKGVPMDPDMNKYDLEHVCTSHSKMSPDEWNKVYRDAWKRYYTDEHVETVIKRAAATGLRMNKIADVMTAFSSAARIEGVHPLQCGIVRRKVRTTRRHGLRIVNPLIFYPVRAVEFVSVVAQWLTVGWRYHRIKKRIVADPSSKSLCRRRDAPGLDRRDGKRRVGQFLRRQNSGYLRRPKKAAGRGLVTRPRLERSHQVPE